MTNGEKIQTILDVDRDCTEVHGENGTMTFTVTQDFWNTEYKPKTVLYSGDGYFDGHMAYGMAECPNCGYSYEEDDKDWGLKFCPNCGQSLNWESEG